METRENKGTRFFVFKPDAPDQFRALKQPGFETPKHFQDVQWRGRVFHGRPQEPLGIVLFSRGTLPTKKGSERAPSWGNWLDARPDFGPEAHGSFKSS